MYLINISLVMYYSKVINYFKLIVNGWVIYNKLSLYNY